VVPGSDDTIPIVPWYTITLNIENKYISIHSIHVFGKEDE
jgi:hypothetical protein